MKHVVVAVAGIALSLGAMPAAGLVGASHASADELRARTAAADTAASARAERRRLGSTLPGVESAGPIPVRTDSGPAAPALPDSVAVVPGGRIINPRTPLLHVPARAEDDAIGIRIFDVSAGESPSAESAWTWQGTLRRGWTRIDERLTPGHGYIVSGYDPEEARWVTFGSFTVSVPARRSGPTTEVGGMSVSLLTGEVRWNWQSEALVGPSDGVGVALSWTSRSEASPGLPPGWQVSVTAGSPWARLTEFGRVEGRTATSAAPAATCDSVLEAGGPRVVALTGWDGSELTFTRTGDGIYRQVTGGVVVPGFANTLSRCVGIDGAATWRFVDVNGMTTEFVNGRARRVIAQDQLVATLAWSGDRLEKVTNPAGRVVDLVYAGSGTCPSASWGNGFGPVPNGMLCRITYPGDAATDFGYLSAGLPHPQIALVKDPGNDGTSLGWTSRGVLYATRSALVNLVATGDTAARSAVASIGFDGEGRARTLRSAPAVAGAAVGTVLTHTVDFPVITEKELRSDDEVAATISSAATGYALRTLYTISARTGEILRTADATGASSETVTDPRTGDFEGMRDPLGRETRYVVDDAGQLTQQVGPFTPGDSTRRGMEQRFTYDTTRVRGEDLAVRGFRADVYDSDRFTGTAIEREFWRLPRSGDAEVRWSGRPARFSARVAAVWTPTRAQEAAAAEEGWSFEIDSSSGTALNVVIGAQVCTDQVCRIRRLPEGDKPILIEILRAPTSGWITIKAATGDRKPAVLPSEQFSPGFQRTSAIEFNDIYSGSAREPGVVYDYANLASDRPSSVTMPGGLTSTMTYEPSRPDRGEFGRLTSYTSPGGQVSRTSYWAITGTVDLPAVCGAGTAVQAGQQRTQRRSDGSAVTTYFDVRGRLIASVTEGTAGSAITACMTYRSDGSPSATSTFGANGRLIERTTIEYNVGGDPLTTRTTVSNGPGAGADANTTVRSTTTVNLLGMPVTYVDEHGTTTRTTYGPVGDPATVTVTPPGAAQPTMTMAYSYRQSDAALTRIVLNDRTAVQVTYASSSDNRITGITYGTGADAIGVSMEYTGSGQPRLLVAAGGGYRVRQEMTYTQFGRLLSSALRVTGTETLEESRSYTYDAARRMTGALIRTNGQDTDYRYTFAATQADRCGSAYPGASRDGLRTGGSRNGVAYTTCYDAEGRATSTTDPLLSGDATATTPVRLEYDNLGRVRTVTGGAADVDIAWEARTQVSSVADGQGAARVTTGMISFADRIVAKSVRTSAGTSSALYSYTSPLDTSPTLLLAGTLGAPGPVQSYSLGLPGGASVTIPVNGSATMTLPGLDGSAAVAVRAPAFDLPVSGSRDPVTGVGLLPRFGPFGEALSVPSAPISAAPSYAWQATSRLETLGGPSSITLMGARPYLAALGLFLAVDPALNASDSLYTYTPGDPVNGLDSTGNANEWSWFWQIVSAVAMVASVVVGAMTGGWLIPIALGMLTTGSQMLSAKTQTEPSPVLDTFRTIQGWASMAAMVVMVGPMVVKGIASAGKWTMGKISAGISRFSRDSFSRTSYASSSSRITGALLRTTVEVETKPGLLTRLGAWLARANPKNAYWSGLDKAGKARSYLKSLGRLSGKLTFLGGAYGFQKIAEDYVPPWMAAMIEENKTATS